MPVPPAAGNFANSDPGINKTVFITGLTLGGTDAPNYVLANTTATATANINALSEPPLSPQQIAITSPDNINRGIFKIPDFDILSVGTKEANTNTNASLKVGHQTVNLAKCFSGNDQHSASSCNQ